MENRQIIQCLDEIEENLKKVTDYKGFTSWLEEAVRKEAMLLVEFFGERPRQMAISFLTAIALVGEVLKEEYPEEYAAAAELSEFLTAAVEERTDITNEFIKTAEEPDKK